MTLTINPSDWTDFVWPVPITDGRIPVISDGWGSGRDGGARRHEGVDIMFRKQGGDPVGPVKHIASKHFIVPAGTLVIAAGPGKVWDTNVTQLGHSMLIDHGVVGTAGGVTTFYQHMSKFSRKWKKGDRVQAGDVLGVIGHSLRDGEQLDHLHFGLNFPRKGIPQSQWPADPAPLMRFWRKVALPSEVA